jgi:flagellar secretion chaperone FliS
MYQSGCSAYRKSAVNVVEDKGVILLKLYDGTLRFLSAARRGIMENKPNVRGENISKVMAIINELDCALDMERGGELSIRLASLYRFVTEKLTAANLHNDLSALRQAEGILVTLKEGFEGAIGKQNIRVATPLPVDSAYVPREGVRFAV